MVTPFQLEVRQYVKALVAGLGAALAFLAGVVEDGLSTAELLSSVATGLGLFTATFYAPNKAAKGQPDDPALSEQSGELGFSSVGYALGVALIVAGILVAVASSLLWGGILAAIGVVLLVTNANG